MLASNGCSYACNSRTAKGSPAMRRLSPFAVFAVVGQLILVASAWILPLVSEYRLVGDNISELAIGRYGFVQTLAFVISGLGVIGLASAIRRLTTGSRGSFVGSLLLGIYGLGALVVAIFPTVGMFVLTWTFARHPRWRSIVVGSALLAGAALAVLFVQAEGPWVGLMQRLLITAISAWLILVAIRVRAIAITDQLRGRLPTSSSATESANHAP